MYSLLWLHLYISLQLIVLPCHVQKVIIIKKNDGALALDGSLQTLRND